MSDQDRDKFIKQINAHLDEAESDLDSETLLRLNRIRQEALGKQERPVQRWRIPTLAVSSTALAAVVMLMVTNMPELVQPNSLEELSLLTDTEEFELIENIEFYQWLTDEKINS